MIAREADRGVVTAEEGASFVEGIGHPPIEASTPPSPCAPSTGTPEVPASTGRDSRGGSRDSRGGGRDSRGGSGDSRGGSGDSRAGKGG
ncbi:hypothetical protein FE697_004330 [Mumia zhuanghuii]|uniref:Uncharacterized protein n=1 Tax=Mumia zhuanghuii TaxID=2585211 RepID=A0A5Q6S4C3_9ACTN|nr:hypothetical protein FE697_004330 [Mumia zhuanghuii]